MRGQPEATGLSHALAWDRMQFEELGFHFDWLVKVVLGMLLCTLPFLSASLLIPWISSRELPLRNPLIVILAIRILERIRPRIFVRIVNCTSHFHSV